MKAPPALPLTDLTTSSPVRYAGVGAGAALLAEARMLVSERRWKDACRVLDAVIRVKEHTIEVDQLLAVAATHAGQRRVADRAIGNLRSELEPSAASLNALATVALARCEFEAADLIARRAVELDSHSATAWGNLAASYAGLGWFDQASECMDRAEALGLENDRRWFIGRSINHWGISRTRATVVTLSLLWFLGLLAVAIGITIPFLSREIRVSKLENRFASMAADAWKAEHRLRFLHAGAVLATLSTWVITLQLA